jgi:hypothetical protein
VDTQASELLIAVVVLIVLYGALVLHDMRKVRGGAKR